MEQAQQQQQQKNQDTNNSNQNNDSTEITDNPIPVADDNNAPTSEYIPPRPQASVRAVTHE